MQMEMVRVGLAGLGFMGGTHAQCYAALPNVELVAVADPEPDRRGKFAQLYGARPFASLEAMLIAVRAGSLELDMVDICMPTYLHRRAVEMAAEERKHVLCEKPMALTLADCDAMIAAVQRAEVQMMIGHCLRFWPEYVVIKQILDSGRLGPVQWMSATRMSALPDWSWQGWQLDPELSGGAVLDLHIHDLDTLQWMLGRPAWINASGAYRPPRGGLDSVFTHLDFPTAGVVATAQGSYALPPGFPFNMGLTVSCREGTILFDMSRTPSLSLYPADGGIEYPEVPKIEVPQGSGAGSGGNISALGGYFNEVQAAILEVLGHGAWGLTGVAPEDARNAVALALAVGRSVDSGEAERL